LPEFYGAWHFQLVYSENFAKSQNTCSCLPSYCTDFQTATAQLSSGTQVFRDDCTTSRFLSISSQTWPHLDNIERKLCLTQLRFFKTWIQNGRLLAFYKRKTKVPHLPSRYSEVKLWLEKWDHKRVVKNHHVIYQEIR
jgi:hypothetical protein